MSLTASPESAANESASEMHIEGFNILCVQYVNLEGLCGGTLSGEGNFRSEMANEEVLLNGRTGFDRGRATGPPHVCPAATPQVCATGLSKPMHSRRFSALVSTVCPPHWQCRDDGQRGCVVWLKLSSLLLGEGAPQRAGCHDRSGWLLCQGLLDLMALSLLLGLLVQQKSHSGHPQVS